VEEIYCKLPYEDGEDEEQEYDDDDYGTGSEFDMMLETGRRLKRQDTDASCPVLMERWKNFTAAAQWRVGDTDYQPWLIDETMEEEEKLSIAYRVLRAVGNAAAVEFYFTTMGVLGKIILITSAENLTELRELRGETHRH